MAVTRTSWPRASAPPARAQAETPPSICLDAARPRSCAARTAIAPLKKKADDLEKQIEATGNQIKLIDPTYSDLIADIDAPPAAAAAAAAAAAPASADSSTARTYTVQPGDSLTLVSHNTGVPIATLEALNPTINVNNLQAGQSIRLRR